MPKKTKKPKKAKAAAKLEIEIKEKGENAEEAAEPERFEIRRQLLHILLGIALVVLIDIGILNAVSIGVIAVIGFLISLNVRKGKILVISWFLDRFERRRYIRKFPGKGVVFYFLGVFIVVLLFPKDIALASIMVLALGDAVSHLWGIHFGQIKNPFADKKFIEGSLSGFAAGFIGAMLYVRPLEAIVASLAAMAAEAVEVTIGTEHVDDNLIVPFIAALGIWLLRVLGGG